jgi:hypothetical protein
MILQALERPARERALTVKVEAASPAVQLGGDTITEASLALELPRSGDDRLSISANLPGRSSIAFDGAVESGAAARFAGKARAAARDLPRLAEWIARADADLADRLSDAIAGGGEWLAVRGHHRPRILLPMPRQARLPAADLAHEHPLPEPEIEAHKVGHPSWHKVEAIADDVGGLDGAGRRGGVEGDGGRCREVAGCFAGGSDAGRRQRDIEIAADAALQIVVRRTRSDHDEEISHREKDS